MNIKLISQGAEQTEELAERLGNNLKGSEVIVLVADLGGGKTTFVRGLSRGIGSNYHVSSPSFTLSHEYHGQHLNLIHFDFYRLKEAGLMENSLSEFISLDKTAVVIEWADTVAHVLPKKHVSIKFKVIDEVGRQLEFSYPKSLAYLMKGLV